VNAVPATTQRGAPGASELRWDRRVRKATSTTRFKRNLFIWGSLIPILGFFFVFSALPIIASLWISMHKWPMLGGARPFVGINNYLTILRDPRFYIIVKNTAYYAVAYMGLVIALGLSMALLLGTLNPVAREAFRALYFIPQVTSAVAVALMFKWLYQPQWGVLNYIFGIVGLGPFRYLTSSAEVMPSLIAVGVWRSLGYSMVIFTAGLLAIPVEMREASAIDGASSWQSLWHIILPMLRPTVLFMFVTCMIGGFQVFTEIWMMSAGGPGTASRVLVLEIYEQGFRFFDMGRASALAVFLFVIIATVSLVQMRSLRDLYEL
jgi:multiple sugar transport system permease protein